MRLPIVHNPAYDAKFSPDHRFPMSKYRLLADAIMAEGLAGPGDFHVPAPAPAAWVKLAHDPAYVDQVYAFDVPRDIEKLRIGASGVLVNLSRAVLLQAQEVFDDFRVISVTARPEVLAGRLAGRGREDADEVKRRLARASLALPEGLKQVYEVDNSGDLCAAIVQAQSIIQAKRG